LSIAAKRYGGRCFIRSAYTFVLSMEDAFI
jgi:hypothetical protein